jgi:hypothetical protein
MGLRFQLSRFRALGNPECRNSNITPLVSPSGEAYALRPVSSSRYREIVIREFALPDAQDHSLRKAPNSDSSGSCTMCPHSDRRLPSNREITICDFSWCKTLTSPTPEHRTPILRDPAPRVSIQINDADQFGESRFVILRGVNLRLVQPQMPKPRCFGFVPPVRVPTNGSD